MTEKLPLYSAILARQMILRGLIALSNLRRSTFRLVLGLVSARILGHGIAIGWTRRRLNEGSMPLAKIEMHVHYKDAAMVA